MVTRAKARAEAVGLDYGRVRLVKGSLDRILLKADLPAKAPEMIMNGEVSDQTAQQWRKKARETIVSLPEYIQGRNRRNNYLASLKDK
jgi:hypothetical protein